MENPLTDFSSLPRFADIRPEHVLPAIESLVSQGRDAIEALATGTGEPTWEGFVEPLETANERLARAWSQVSHLNAVVNSPALREAYNAALPRVTQFSTEQSQDLRLYGYSCDEVTEEDFLEVYPMLPGHVDLLMQITSNLRTRSRRVQGDDHAILHCNCVGVAAGGIGAQHRAVDKG